MLGVMWLGIVDYVYVLLYDCEWFVLCGWLFGEMEVWVVDVDGCEVEGDVIGELVICGVDVF